MDNQISNYDRLYGGLIDVSLATKPSTVKVVQPLTGARRDVHHTDGATG